MRAELASYASSAGVGQSCHTTRHLLKYNRSPLASLKGGDSQFNQVVTTPDFSSVRVPDKLSMKFWAVAITGSNVPVLGSCRD